MLLSVLYVRFRDVEPIWEVVTQILFYGSPVLYVSTLVDDCCQRPYVSSRSPPSSPRCAMRSSTTRLRA